MRPAIGRGPPRTPPCTTIGRLRVICRVAHETLVTSSVLADGLDVDVLASEELHRPAPLPAPQPILERPSAGRITPTKIAGFSAVLRLPATRVEALLQVSPLAVHALEPHHVAQRLQELCLALGLRPKQAAFMVTKQPAYLLLTPMEDIQTKVRRLAEALGVPPAAVLRTALTVPSILARQIPTVQRRVQAYAVLLHCTPLDVLHVLSRGPEYLSDTPSSVRRRMVAMGYVLRRPKCAIAAMLHSRPDLVSMSFRVMNTKVNGLMCIMDKAKRHIVTLIAKTPALMRCDLDRARYVFEGLQALLRKRDGFVYAMVCHAPHLLLLTPRGMHQRCAALQRCLSVSSAWQEQFQQLRPPKVAQLLLNSRRSLSVMMYLFDRGRQGSVPLERLLDRSAGGGPEKVLGELWPDFQAWMVRRQQYAALRAQQHTASVLQQQQGSVGAPPLVSARPFVLEQAAQRREGAALPSPSVAQPQQQAPPRRLWAAPPHAAALLGAARASQDAGSLPSEQNLASSPQRMAGSTVERAETSAHGLSELQTVGTSGGGRIGAASTSGLAGDNQPGADLLLDATGKGRQQPEASTSGRQPSWLQLRAQYLRSRQRLASTGSFPRGQPASKASPPLKRNSKWARAAADPQAVAVRQKQWAVLGKGQGRFVQRRAAGCGDTTSKRLGSAPHGLPNQVAVAHGKGNRATWLHASAPLGLESGLLAIATGDGLTNAIGTGLPGVKGTADATPRGAHVQQTTPRHPLRNLLGQGPDMVQAHSGRNTGGNGADQDGSTKALAGSGLMQPELLGLGTTAGHSQQHASLVSVHTAVTAAVAAGPPPGFEAVLQLTSSAKGAGAVLGGHGLSHHSTWPPVDASSRCTGSNHGASGRVPVGPPASMLAQHQHQQDHQLKTFRLRVKEEAVDAGHGRHEAPEASVLVVSGEALGCGLQEVGRECGPRKQQRRQGTVRDFAAGLGPGQGQEHAFMESTVGATVPR